MNTSVLWEHTQAMENPRLSVSNNILLASALQIMIVKHLTRTSQSFILTASTVHKDTSLFFKMFVERLSHTIDVMAMQLVWHEYHSRPYVRGPRIYNLLLVDSYESFLSTAPINHTQNYNFNEYYYIILHERTHYNQYSMTHIFRYCWRNHLINCNVQIQATNEPRLLMYTYNPFLAGRCGKAEPVLVNEFSNNRWQKRGIFPRKLRNMNGCPLRVATWNVPPFVAITKFSNGSQTLDGFEGNLLNGLASIMNFQIQLVEVTLPKYYYMLSDKQPSLNDYIQAGLALLRRREADLCIGYIHENERRDRIVSSVFPHQQLPLVLSVLRNGNPYSRLSILIFPFSSTIWSLIMATLVLQYLLIYFIIPAKRRLGWSFVLSLALGVPTVYMPTSSARRMLYMAWLLFNFIWRNIYCAVLFDFFCRNFYREPPTTPKQLLAEDYLLVCSQNIHKLITSFLQQYPLRVHVLSSLNESAALDYLDAHPKLKVAAITSAPIIAVHSNPNLYYILPEIVMNIQTSMYVVKHSYLIDHLNQQLPWFMSSGYLRHWVRHNVATKYVKQLKVNHEVRLIKYEDLKFIFKLIIRLFILAIATFVMEFTWQKLRNFYMKLRNFFQFIRNQN